MDHHNIRNRSASLRKDENSLGILNMDQLKGRGRFFGDLSTDSFRNANHTNTGSNENGRRISDRLNSERTKALETLQKSQKGDIFKKPNAVTNKENLKCSINVSGNPSVGNSTNLDHTDYVPFRRPNTINISDLVTDETINLETSSCPPSASKDVKVSFEPAEITGRSTLYKKDMNRNNVAGGGGAGVGYQKTKNISVSDILASSIAPKARNLCETLKDGEISMDLSVQVTTGGRAISSASSSTACSSFTSYNGSRSLPRTADMSLSKNTCSEESFNRGTGRFSISSVGAGAGYNESGFSNEEFAPGELMESKLLNDEISWAQERAAIPTAALSEQAKAKVARASGIPSSAFDSSSTSNSLIAGDPNFSVGNFFHIRSDDIWNIVNSKSPDKCRTPVALVDDEDNNTVTTTTTVEMDSATNLSITPKIDNKTYTRVGAASLQIPIETPTQSISTSSTTNRHESKDSGNASENSYLLSMSAIDRALCNLDIHPDASGVGVAEQLLMEGKKSKSCMNPYRELSNVEQQRFQGRSLGTDNKLLTNTNIAEMILENKENFDPEAIRHSDTMSFTESILNSSEMKQLQRSSINKPRSPLSPINVDVPNIRVSVSESVNGEEADNDEWPGTPITNNRRIRRTKSPHDKSPSELKKDHEDLAHATTPVNSRPFHSYVSNNNKINKNNIKVSKSLSSTRLDGADRIANSECNFAISPNMSNCASSMVHSNTLIPPRSVSPARLDNSPMSSPRSYHLSHVSSPSPSNSGFRSPNLDTTTNSDRQLLSAGAVNKVVSSPVGSEASSSCSYGTTQTYRSALSASSGRSVSRCSSSSEFSHRDGKQIPLKVTNTELSWGSVKLRSDSIKSMQVKNIFNKRLVIRIEVSGPGFQIVNNSQRNNTVTLQSQECRSISISFCPTVRGVAIGKLSFYAPSSATPMGHSFMDVPLYGYGGHASVILQNVIVAPVGNRFVNMGYVCELVQPLERKVSFYNRGSILGFAVVNIDSTGLMMPRLGDAFEIYPRKVLIPPKSMVDVRIVFKPKREEIRKIIKKMGDVLTLANMRVICGDEANRQRIRHLLMQMSQDERSKLSSPILDMLWTIFPEEIEMQDVYSIRENPNIAVELASGFLIHEVLLTITHDNMNETGETSSLYLPDVDETVLFRTVCHADSPNPPSTLRTVDEMFEDGGGGGSDAAGERAVSSSGQGSWSVTPNALEINSNRPESISLFVYNGFKSRQYYEVACNPIQALCFTPCEGYVAPDGGKSEIKVAINRNFQYTPEDVVIMIYMENERIKVPVKIYK